MNKTVNTLLQEYHLFLLTDRLNVLQDKASEEINSLNEQISKLKQNGFSIPKGNMKKYLIMEVKETPKLIKTNNATIGIALQISSKSLSGVSDMPVYFTYMRYDNKDIFRVTEFPTEYVTEIGNFPKEVKNLNFQLGVSPILTHLVYTDNLKLIFEKYSSTIRKMPENYLVAVLSNNSVLDFSSQDACVREMDKEIVTDMWKRGLIPTKESNLI